MPETARTDASRFAELLLAGTPLIDVRAEVEFAAGSIPGARNFPILTTEERHRVGTCYKQRGQAAAIELGHQLVAGVVREQRIAAWCAFARAHPAAHLYCWRGGLRSRLAGEWMAAAGCPVPVVPGGYKALRHRLLEELAAGASREPLYVIGGRTGSAKTMLIERLPGGVDLEGFARHRGSSFGRRPGTPPAQVDFENGVALALLRHRSERPGGALFLEDESRQIGPSTIPLELFRAMKEAPLVLLEVPLEERIERIAEDYIAGDAAAFVAADPEQGFARFGEHLGAALDRIRRRLGDERHGRARQLLLEALRAQHETGDTQAHGHWIELLLREYYDPMYEYQLEQSRDRVVFRGDRAAVLAWCLERAGRR